MKFKIKLFEINVKLKKNIKAYFSAIEILSFFSF